VEKEPSSEQEEYEGVGDAFPCCWTRPVSLAVVELKELDLLGENSRNPPSSGLSLPFLAANFDFGDGSVLLFLLSSPALGIH
jgi:hypothetical protein